MGVRESILEELQRRPGARASELARAVDVDPTTVSYHLRRLAREGAVGEAHRRWFAAGSVAPSHRARHVANARVLQVVSAGPGATKGALARSLGVARGTLGWHLAKLERAGLVRVERRGRVARVWPAGDFL